MTIQNLEHPMTTKAQLIGYCIINGTSKTFDYFAEVNSQPEIDTRKNDLFKQLKLETDKKIQFITRQVPGAGLHG